MLRYFEIIDPHTWTKYRVPVEMDGSSYGEIDETARHLLELMIPPPRYTLVVPPGWDRTVH